MKATALIADDEPLARQRIRDLLDEVDWLECISETKDGLSALRAIDELEPDLVFLDVRMPKLSAIEVVRRARHKPAVIFTTAFDQYAVTAFELHALDYLLKPFGRDRFMAALERARWMLQESHSVAEAERITGLGQPGVLKRLFIRERSGILPVLVEHIVRIEACDDYAGLHVNGRMHLIHVTMNAIESHLDPDVFLRVHRSHIVNLDHVVALEPYDSSRLTVKMSDGSHIVASRRRSKALKERAL